MEGRHLRKIQPADAWDDPDPDDTLVSFPGFSFHCRFDAGLKPLVEKLRHRQALGSNRQSLRMIVERLGELVPYFSGILPLT